MNALQAASLVAFRIGICNRPRAIFDIMSRSRAAAAEISVMYNGPRKSQENRPKLAIRGTQDLH
jgi:hypothetical protein